VNEGNKKPIAKWISKTFWPGFLMFEIIRSYDVWEDFVWIEFHNFGGGGGPLIATGAHNSKNHYRSENSFHCFPFTNASTTAGSANVVVSPI